MMNVYCRSSEPKRLYLLSDGFQPHPWQSSAPLLGVFVSERVERFDLCSDGILPLFADVDSTEQIIPSRQGRQTTLIFAT